MDLLFLTSFSFRDVSDLGGVLEPGDSDTSTPLFPPCLYILLAATAAPVAPAPFVLRPLLSLRTEGKERTDRLDKIIVLYINGLRVAFLAICIIDRMDSKTKAVYYRNIVLNKLYSMRENLIYVSKF